MTDPSRCLDLYADLECAHEQLRALVQVRQRLVLPDDWKLSSRYARISVSTGVASINAFIATLFSTQLWS